MLVSLALGALALLPAAMTAEEKPLAEQQCPPGQESALVYLFHGEMVDREDDTTMRLLHQKWMDVGEYMAQRTAISNYAHSTSNKYGQMGGMIVFQSTSADDAPADTEALPMKAAFETLTSTPPYVDYDTYWDQYTKDYQGKQRAAVQYLTCTPSAWDATPKPTGEAHVGLIFDVVSELPGCADIIVGNVTYYAEQAAERADVTFASKRAVCGSQIPQSLDTTDSMTMDLWNKEDGEAAPGSDVGCLINFANMPDMQTVYMDVWAWVAEAIGDSGYYDGVVDMGKCVKDWWIVSML